MSFGSNPGIEEIWVDGPAVLPECIGWLPKPLKHRSYGQPSRLKGNAAAWCQDHIGPVKIVLVKWRMVNHDLGHYNSRYAIQFSAVADMLLFKIHFDVTAW